MNIFNLQKAIELRHTLHMCPELSMCETETKRTLIEFLRENTELEIIDKGRWFYAIYKAGDDCRNIAFRADMDAIPVEEASDFVAYASKNPGVSHKCGHDGHCAAMASFALELNERQDIDKNIFLLFQHAEETGQGAAECLSFIKENNIKEIYAFHNLPGLDFKAVACPDGPAQCASTGMILRFQGKKSHASYPEKGINPAYAIAEIINILPLLANQNLYQGLVLVTIVQINVGERAFGVSAGDGELLLTIRGENESELNDLIRKIKDIAYQKACVYAMQCEIQFDDKFPETRNHHSAMLKVKEAAETSGLKFEVLEEKWRSSEDFGYFTKEIPGAMFYIGDGKDYPSLHTSEYNFPDELIETATDMFYKIAQIA